MARILITSGPTRQYIDPVRFLTNSSSGRMGAAVAEAAIAAGHEAIVVSGPVGVEYPAAAEVHAVVSTEEMLAASRELFPSCDGMFGVAAPCDYRPRRVESHKIAKTGRPLTLELVETPDIVADLAADKRGRWVVGFALETDDHRLRALGKLQKKCCDLVVVNDAAVMHSPETHIQVLDAAGELAGEHRGGKTAAAVFLMQLVEERLIKKTR